MAVTSRLSKLKEAADKKKKAGPTKAEEAKPAPQKEASKAAPMKQAQKEAAVESKPGLAGTPELAPQSPSTTPPIQAEASPPSLNVLIMSDERIPQLPDKLEVFRNVLKRYDEIEKGKDAKKVVEEEIKAFLAKNK